MMGCWVTMLFTGWWVFYPPGMASEGVSSISRGQANWTTWSPNMFCIKNSCKKRHRKCSQCNVCARWCFLLQKQSRKEPIRSFDNKNLYNSIILLLFITLLLLCSAVVAIAVLVTSVFLTNPHYDSHWLPLILYLSMLYNVISGL